jgi:predicted HTH transcriptional regulator
MNSPDQLQTIGKWTPEYLQELPPIELDWLDYKASAWLKIDSFPWDEISKYLSAYSNFDGGYLIIGATNPKPGNPLQLDGEVDFNLKNGIQGWLEDKLPNLTDPKLPKIQIQPIPLSPRENRGPLVIYVPPCSQAPHQARDHKFYTRIGSKLQALSTRAVFDIANRQKHPVVSVSVISTYFNMTITIILVAISFGR